MPDPQPQLTDCTVTLAGEELPACEVEFDAREVVLRRPDWDEDAIKAMRGRFRDSDVQTLTITLPDRRFEYPVPTPSVRRYLDDEGAAVEVTFTVLDTGYCRSFIGTESEG